MTNVIEFPGKDQRQWMEVAQGLTLFLVNLGASQDELPVLLDRLKARWEKLGVCTQLKPKFILPTPLNAEQIQAIDEAIKSIVADVVGKWKTENGATLLDFARLELELFRCHQ